MELQKFVTTILASMTVSGTLAAAVVWLSRSWIAERLRQSIKHEYDLRLSTLNSQMSAEAEKNALMLKATFEKESERLRFANASIAETQRAAVSRKLDAIETLWEAVIEARKNVPAVMGFIDILTVDEYKSSKDHPHFKQLVGDLSVEGLTAMYNDNVGSRERIRPYIGEYLWALLSTYQALITRVALLLHWGEKDEEKLNWHLDNGVRQLLATFLSENEVQAFDEVKIAKIAWLQRNLEKKILSSVALVVSGQKFGDEAIEQAQRMEDKVRQLQSEVTGA